MAFLGHHPSLAPLETRKRAFLETVKQYGGQVEFTTVVNNDELAGAMQAVHELCSSGFNPSAIVCVNDYMAIGAMMNPRLTTANIPRSVIGRMAVEALLQAEISSAGQEVSIEPELVLRDSTGPVCCQECIRV